GFESLFATATGGLALADTSLKSAAVLSLFPSSGVIKSAASTASIELAAPAGADVSFGITAQNGFVSTPNSVTIPAGAKRATFTIRGITPGVDEILATPSDARYETAFARVQVSDPGVPLRIAVVSSDPAAVVVRVADANDVPYPGIVLQTSLSDQGKVTP